MPSGLFSATRGPTRSVPRPPRGAGAGSRERYEKTAEAKSTGDETVPHMQNLFAAMRARDYKLLHAEIEMGARSAAFCHLANIAHRAGHTLLMDPATGRFTNDEKANAMLTREYRAPYVVAKLA